jgi:thioredoxin 1
MVSEISDANFEQEVIKSTIPVLLDMWAPWCGPCRMVAPLVDKLSESAEFKGKVKFLKMNVDDNPKIPAQFRVMSIPTLLFFKQGKAVDTVVGAVPERSLQPKIKALLET